MFPRKARSDCPARLCWKAGQLKRLANTTMPTAVSPQAAAVVVGTLVVIAVLVATVSQVDVTMIALPVVIVDPVAVTDVQAVATAVPPDEINSTN